MKRGIKFDYNQTDKLSELIEDVYFGKESYMGRRPENPEQSLILDQDDIYYKVLSGLEYNVKIKNDDIIDGTMEFSIKENDDSIELFPSSIVCIKENNRYAFY